MNFDKISEILSNDCTQFLDLLREKNSTTYPPINGLYRGATIHETPIVDGFWKMKPHENRLSRDTKLSVQKIFDDELEKRFGIRLRSKGVFASKDISIASDYGKFRKTSYLFIPTDGFRYFWNPKIEDLFTYIRDEWWYQKDQFFWDRGAYNDIKSICDGYQEGGIEQVKWQELTFICDSYYLLDLDYYDEFLK